MIEGYTTWHHEWEKVAKEVDTGAIVDLHLQSVSEKALSQAKVKLFSKEVEAGSPITLIGPFGQPFAEGKYFIEIVEISPVEED